MGEFNSDDHYIYYCGQESLRRNAVAIMVNKRGNKMPSSVYIQRMRTSIWHAAAKSLHSFPTLCNPIDGSPPGSPIPGILQARTLEWVAIAFSNA